MSQVMQDMLAALDENQIDRESETLEKFYASVRLRASGIDNAEGRQRIITELYEKFFKVAFPRVAESLGIVYTPVEIVDFIIRSVEYVLKDQFGASISDPGRPHPRPVHRHRHLHRPPAAVRADQPARSGPQVRQRAARERDPAARLLHRRDQHRSHLPRTWPGASTCRSAASCSPTPSR